MKQQSQDPLERFDLINANVQINRFAYTSHTWKWGVYGRHPRNPNKWQRIAARDTKQEIQAFCKEWRLNIIEDKTLEHPG